MPLSKAELVAAGESRPYEDIPTPAGDVRVGVMPGIERAKWDDACTDYSKIESPTSADTLRMQSRLICLSVIDPETGNRMFSDDDIDAVSGWQSPMIWPLYRAAYRINALGFSAVEEAEKN